MYAKLDPNDFSNTFPNVPNAVSDRSAGHFHALVMCTVWTGTI